MRVLVNGTPTSVRLDYDAVVDMAGELGCPTIKFTHGPSGRAEGLLMPGYYVEVCDGMRFSVAHTDNA